MVSLRIWGPTGEAPLGEAARGGAGLGEGTLWDGAPGEETFGDAALGEVTLGEAALGEETRGETGLTGNAGGVLGISEDVVGLINNSSASPRIFSMLLGSLKRGINDLFSPCFNLPRPFFFSFELFLSVPCNSRSKLVNHLEARSLLTFMILSSQLSGVGKDTKYKHESYTSAKAALT